MTEKSWQKLIVHCPLATTESIASFITDLTGTGVEIADDKHSADRAFIIGYLDTDDSCLTDKLAAVRGYIIDIFKQLPQFPQATMELDSIENQDWQRKWKESFKPFNLSENIIIKPSWEKYTPGPKEKVIEIDPGMAFGTGLHASTRLAAELMETRLSANPSLPERVLDVGTGTGILAIGSALLGCRKVTAIDNDPEAITAAANNIAANRMSDYIEVSTTNLSDLVGPYEMILANIIHNTLVEMAPVLVKLLTPGGNLILAGILNGKQAENIINVYNDAGLTMIESRNSDEWAALSFGKQ